MLSNFTEYMFHRGFQERFTAGCIHAIIDAIIKETTTLMRDMSLLNDKQRRAPMAESVLIGKAADTPR